jgi:hypothetical protein
MSYLALGLSSNLVLAGCSNRAAPKPAVYRSSEPTILDYPPEKHPESVPPEASAGAAEAAIATSLAALRTPGEDHFGYCAAGLGRSGDAALDLVRLGAVCGPGNGLLVFEPAFQATASVQSLHRRLDLDRGLCVRVAVATEDPAQTVSVRVEGPGKTPPVSCKVGFGWCPASGVWCTKRGEVELDFSANGGDVPFHARIWTLKPQPLLNPSVAGAPAP